MRIAHAMRTAARSSCLLLLLGLPCGAMAQAGVDADRIKARVAADERVTLTGHRPQWAKRANERGALPATFELDHLTVVVKRGATRQLAYDAYLRALQDPTSPDYHKWLSVEEIGARFGADDSELAAVRHWLEREGLRVDSVSPTRRLLRFSGRAAAIERAFGSSLRLYDVAGIKHMAPAAALSVPADVAAQVESLVGFETMRLDPLLRGPELGDSASLGDTVRPKGSNCGANGCERYLFPGDFAVIYGLDAAQDQGYDGSGQSIAIVARSRVHAEDVKQFRSRSALPAMAFSTIVADDGIDPGPAADSCGGTGEPSCDDPGDAVLDQSEATMDVTRAGGTAPGAAIKLVTSGKVGNVDGVYIALEHAIHAQPLPARIISVSYGTCEADNSAGAATYIDELFADAAMQGISVFVSSGDSGAGDCSPHHEAPDGDRRLSVNLLCSSEHVTCVGGTELTQPPLGQYWYDQNGPGYTSARLYMPESAWNEPLDDDGATQVVAGGGGVSQYYATPSWQVGAGVPDTRAGRYVPDVSFSASSRTGYFYCMAAYEASCVSNANGGFRFVLGSGTSASAPSMAGIAAMLNQRADAAQGNLNPRLYALAGSPANGVFHDVTLGSSGWVGSSCDIGTPSACNNSTPGTPGSETLVGYAVGDRYDLVTGLGSLDASRLLEAWPAQASLGARLNQRGISGSWANRETDSQGFVLEVTPDHFDAQTGNLFAGWFTYTEGNHERRWYTLQGKVGENASATLPIYETTGGRFDSAQATTTEVVGMAILSLEDCASGQLDYTFDDGRRGSIPLSRLLANVNCNAQETPPAAPADALYAGTWAGVGNSGQGLVLDVVPAQSLLFGAWYTFAPTAAAGSDATGQRWFTLQAGFPAGARELANVGIFESTGGAFDRPAETSTIQIGSADIEFASCSRATLDYHLTGGGFAGRSGRLDLHRITPVPAGCQ